MYIIDRIEHGNGGVCNLKILFKGNLSKCLKKSPSDYGVHEKMFGFTPGIEKGAQQMRAVEQRLPCFAACAAG